MAFPVPAYVESSCSGIVNTGHVCGSSKKRANTAMAALAQSNPKALSIFSVFGQFGMISIHVIGNGFDRFMRLFQTQGTRLSSFCFVYLDKSALLLMLFWLYCVGNIDFFALGFFVANIWHRFQLATDNVAVCVALGVVQGI
eukprot:scaffold40646_cov206-Amphora_coffeaeformis.AAC.3